MLELKVGKIEEHIELLHVVKASSGTVSKEREKQLIYVGTAVWRFVISKSGKYMVFHAAVPGKKGINFTHEDLVDKYDIKNVLGGGHMHYCSGSLDFIGSCNYGSIPNSAMVGFVKLLSKELKDYRIRVYDFRMYNSDDKKEHQRWGKLGHRF